MANRKGKKLIKVDFTGVTAEGGKLLPEEPFKLEVEEVEEKEGEDSGKPYLEFKFKVVEGEFEGTTAYDNMSLQPQALWKLRGFMEAAGVETVDGPMDIDPDELIGLVVTGHIIHEPYKGRDKHRIDSYSPVEDDEPTPSKSGVKKKASKDDDSEPEWKVKQRVSFMDGKKKIDGTITKIDGDSVDVRVGKDEYEVNVSDLTAA
jgi:hypothetical protein